MCVAELACAPMKTLVKTTAFLAMAAVVGFTAPHARAAEIVCSNGWEVYECGDGTEFACVFHGPDGAYQVDCGDYQQTFGSAAQFFCEAGHGGLAAPPIVDSGPTCEAIADEREVADEDDDLDGTQPRR